ncbi:unnamed protein product, partial [Symbiodinium necroappetens]
YCNDRAEYPGKDAVPAVERSGCRSVGQSPREELLDCDTGDIAHDRAPYFELSDVA